MRSNLHPVFARASGIYGYIEAQIGMDGGVDVNSPHRAQLALRVEDLDTGNQLRDVEMLRRLESRVHPTIEWVVKEAQPRADSLYRAFGEVTVHGQAQPIEGEFRISAAGDRIVVEGEHFFDIRDFGIVPPRFFWLWMEPDITVRIRVVARQVSS
jgi:polyisoprenoid-binding protein YceI